ncbi:B-cell receptor CD22 isoform X2 [Pogona vitticeps]
MRCFFLLLFLEGCRSSSETPLTIEPSSLAGWKGSCILIPCQIKNTYGGRRLNNISLIWYFDPSYDGKEYTGTILYNSSRTSQKHVIPTIAGLQERVTFAGDLNERNCDLKISQLQTSDHGLYGARLHGILEDETIVKDWFQSASVNILDSPPKPKLQIYPEETDDGLTTSVSCSMPYHCLDQPLTLVLHLENRLGLKEQHPSTQRPSDKNREVRKELSFVPTWVDHGKLLTCSITDQGTEISQSTRKLDVKHAPKGVELRAYPGPTLREGETLSLDCLVNSSHPVVLGYQWLRNNHLIAGRINGSRMEIDPVERQHAGHYRCRTRNALGTTESNALIIDVQYPPKEIKIPSRSRTIEENDVVNLKCSFIANPPITKYEWYKTPASNVIGSQRELRFQAIQAIDSGTYYCKAHNPVGQSTSSLFTLDVRYAPKPVELRASPGTTLREGETLSLECLVRTSQRAVLEYQWWKDNHLTNGRINESRMTIDPVGRQHSGHYKCGARTTLGTTESNELPIDVQYRPKDVQLAILNSLPIKEGQTIQFNCSVGSSNPTTNWYKLLENNVVRTRPAESSLITSPAKPGRATTYHCEVCNNVGCTSSPRISVNVHFAPKNVKAVRDPPGPIKEGAFLNLSCQVEAANPEEMTYRWSKDQQPLDAKGAALILQEVAPGDSGSYSCDATNTVGTTASRPLQLNVQYGPRSVSVTVDTKEAIIEGNNVLLRCENDAKPPSHSYKWYWNGEEIFQKTSDVLELQKVEVWQSGDYFCTASNEISENESQSVALIVSCE